MSRVAVETMGGHGIVTVTGEVTTNAYVDVPAIVHRIAGNVGVQVNLVKQSNEIAQGVDIGGAGDQGTMIGYACNETPEMMPLEYTLARDLCMQIFMAYPVDGKVQVTLENDKIIAIVASFQNTTKEQLIKVIHTWCNFRNFEVSTLYVNEAGEWQQGGFDADTGVTGRKIVADAYGCRVPVGGGAFSGKDPTKVDRSAAYMARKIAVDLLKKNNAQEVTVNLAYVIGKPEPLQSTVQINDWEEVDLTSIAAYDLTPKGIIEFLDLRKPIYEMTACWGHFGQDNTWDK